MSGLGHIAFVCAASAAIAACGATQQKPGKGEKLIDVTVQTLDGKATSLAKVIGGRVAVFKFGATWCGWCNKQLAEFNKVAKAYPAKKVVVLDIDVGEDAAQVRAHAKEHKVAFTTLLDPEGKAAARYNVQGIPVTVVAAPDGTVLYRGYYTPFAQLRRHIEPAVAKLNRQHKRKASAAARAR